MDRQIGIAIVVALALTGAIRILAPSETAASHQTAKAAIPASEAAQPDMTWLVGP